MLLLRAFYVKFNSMKTDESKKTKDLIAKCLWKIDEFGTTKEPTENEELKQLATSHQDFTEKDILERNTKIINAFINYLDENNLIK